MSDTGGIHRGSVHDINDPENRGRLRLLVPDVLGDAPSTWAEPALPTASESVWSAGDKVWVLFEGENVNRPVYISRMEVQRGDIAPGSVGQEQIDPEVNLGSGPTAPPASSPSVTATPIIKGLNVRAVELPEFTDALTFQVSTSNTFSVILLSITVQQSSTLLAPLPTGVDLWVRAIASNALGPAPPGPTYGPVRSMLVESVDVADFTFTAKKFFSTRHELY